MVNTGTIIEEIEHKLQKTAKKQRAAFEKFFSGIDEIDDEPITDDDLKYFTENKINFRNTSES